MDFTFTIDVTLTDRSRNDAGGFNTFTDRVVVLAATDTDARIIAIQMATSVHPFSTMPLGDKIISITA